MPNLLRRILHGLRFTLAYALHGAAWDQACAEREAQRFPSLGNLHYEHAEVYLNRIAGEIHGRLDKADRFVLIVFTPPVSKLLVSASPGGCRKSILNVLAGATETLQEGGPDEE
jgi:hypothetical protein